MVPAPASGVTRRVNTIPVQKPQTSAAPSMVSPNAAGPAQTAKISAAQKMSMPPSALRCRNGRRNSAVASPGRGDAQRAAPVADVGVIAEESPRQGPGQQVPGHGGAAETACGRPAQPARPGDHGSARQDGGRDDPEVADPDQPVRAEGTRQVDDVDHRQRGQRRHADGTRDQIGVRSGLRSAKTTKHQSSPLSYRAWHRDAVPGDSSFAFNY